MRLGHDSNLNLDDTTNPNEMNGDGFGLKEPKKGDYKKETSFKGVKKPKSKPAEGLTEMKSNKTDYTFLNEKWDS